MLEQIKIASPCSADWEQMEGNDRVRFCSECKKNVFNLSAMTRRDGEALLKETNGNLCARIYRRNDGTVLTEDCPVGLQTKIARVRRRIGWAVTTALSLSAAQAKEVGTLTGTIRNEDGSLAAKTAVLIKGDHARVETITDERGAFKVDDLAPGLYTVRSANMIAGAEVEAGRSIELVFARPMMVQGEIVSFKRKPWYRRLL
jgi:hypothetical protein